MKNGNVTVKNALTVVGFLAMIFVPYLTMGQSLSDFENQLESEASTIENIAKIILRVILILGVLGVVWAYASKDSDAKKYLVHFAIAIVISGISLAVLF